MPRGGDDGFASEGTSGSSILNRRIERPARCVNVANPAGRGAEYPDLVGRLVRADTAEFLGPVRVRDVETAQVSIVARIRALEQAVSDERYARRRLLRDPARC